MSAFHPLRTLEFSCARFGDQLVLILPNNVPRVSGCEDFDMNAARFQRQLQLMHLFDVFGSHRLEPRQSWLPASLPASARKLAWNRQIFFKPAIYLADLTQRPRGRKIAIPCFIQRLEKAEPLPLAFDQAETDKADINSGRLSH